MSTFETTALVNHPLDVVFAANRDALALAIAHVEELHHVVKERIEHPDGSVELTNIWQASVDVPKAIESMVKPHMVVWTDHSIWTSEDHTVRWKINAPFFPDNVICSGATSYEETARGRATRLTLKGEIVVEPRGLLGLPESVERAIARGIEEFVCAVFPMGVRKVADAVSRHLSEREQHRPSDGEGRP